MQIIEKYGISEALNCKGEVVVIDVLRAFTTAAFAFFTISCAEDLIGTSRTRTCSRVARVSQSPPSGRPLHDYTPLYFGFKTPMVAWNQAHNEELIFLRFSLNILASEGVIITDGNARSSGTQLRRFQSLDDLSILDVRAVNSVRYAGDPEMKRKKQAEILIPDAIAFSNVLDIICFSTTAQNRVLAILAKSGMKKSVKVNPGWYFTTSGSQSSRTSGA